jgi:hypothetical protein
MQLVARFPACGDKCGGAACAQPRMDEEVRNGVMRRGAGSALLRSSSRPAVAAALRNCGRLRLRLHGAAEPARAASAAAVMRPGCQPVRPPDRYPLCWPFRPCAFQAGSGGPAGAARAGACVAAVLDAGRCRNCVLQRCGKVRWPAASLPHGAAAQAAKWACAAKLGCSARGFAGRALLFHTLLCCNDTAGAAWPVLAGLPSHGMPVMRLRPHAKFRMVHGSVCTKLD